EVFKTETRAVLGEYNKSSSDPIEKLEETVRDTAFLRHTYKHTTIGLLQDIEDMPNQFGYGIEFFNRYYRPEFTTIIVAGDVSRNFVRSAVDRYWGKWKSGDYRPAVPAEASQEEPSPGQGTRPGQTQPRL